MSTDLRQRCVCKHDRGYHYDSGECFGGYCGCTGFTPVSDPRALAEDEKYHALWLKYVSQSADLRRRLREVETERDRYREQLSEARRSVTAYFDDHVIEGDPPCPCNACEKARAVFAAALSPVRSTRLSEAT